VHSKIGRLGAIKILKPSSVSEDVIERFYQEARAVNAIKHENIVDIYDFGRRSVRARVLGWVPRGRAAVGLTTAARPGSRRLDPRAGAAH
jgi:hypothetical protein